MTNTTAIATQSLTIVGPNLPRQAKATFHVHDSECAELTSGWLGRLLNREPDLAWTEDYASRTDVEADIYPNALDRDPTYTLGAWQDEFHFCGCVNVH